jgi:hypothetical protein
MAGDVYVSFGADTGELEGAFQLAKAQANSLQRELGALAREMVKTGQEADAALGQKLTSLGSQLSGAKGRSGAISSGGFIPSVRRSSSA